MRIKKSELKSFLDEKYHQYNLENFIEHDPIKIPHQFSKKEDIEIAAFLSATIAWGNRKTIINNATKMMELMDNAPHDFILNSTLNDLKAFNDFKHRTFNSDDLSYFILALSNLYRKHEGLEASFKGTNAKEGIINFRKLFFELEHPSRTQKHVSNPEKGSSAKRLNMFLRWMVRQDEFGVDFGLWKVLSPSQLYLPLDVHTGNVSRKLGLLQRKQNDWKSVNEITEELRKLDPQDPIKYDFALFGLGVFEKF